MKKALDRVNAGLRGPDWQTCHARYLAMLRGSAFSQASVGRPTLYFHEEDVLLGARSLIARDRLSLMVEVEERHNPGSIERVKRFFEARGHCGFFFDGSALRSMEKLDPSIHQSPDRKPYINNFFFCPTEFDVRSTGIPVEGQIAG